MSEVLIRTLKTFVEGVKEEGAKEECKYVQFDKSEAKILLEEIERLNKNKKEALEFIERYLQLNLEEFNANSLLNKLKEILERGNK